MVETLQDDEPLLRYISFTKFASMLRSRSIWLSRIDLLGDPWELQYRMLQHWPEPTPEQTRRLQEIYDIWTSMFFVSCWSRDAVESHALWRIYCPSSEAVAVQTTARRLRQLQPANLYPVDYVPAVPIDDDLAMTATRCATTKTPMYAYEKEVRLLLKEKDMADHGLANPFEFPPGVQLPWDLEPNIDAVLVHPEAHPSFVETVRTEIQQHAPALIDKVRWSAMRTPPPFTKRHDFISR